MPSNDPWYRNAITYAIDIEKFADGNGDGRGDFEGLIAKLDYLEYVGVTCIWLLPFYTSPRRDNGYDVVDHYSVDPRLGTLHQFEWFVRSAGERGIRVIIDIVMDHTSDQHPWFQASRRDPLSRFRDYYTWSEVPVPGGLAHGSAFPGEEESLWKFDSTAGAYYYHPFYRFQPQLNFSNPAVQDELHRVLDFWMCFGVSGFRIDAVPLMLGLEGPMPNPPRDPHLILEDARAMLERRQSDLSLMGEVDVEAGKLIGYFGEGNELNALLNFLLNNYLFLGLASEDADCIVRGLRMLPPAPDGCQWVNFLRNLDELNLQWLTERDRNFVWDRYAPDPDMRIYNRGVRRRLAPMIANPDKLKMAMSLLFSLPGAPMIAYGDEIGIGDDLSQRGRDACRMPMQWNDGPNAGFSAADATELIRPVVTGGPFGYETVNVAQQMGDPDSMLQCVRGLAKARAGTPELGSGQWRPLEELPEGVLGFQCLRENGLVILLHNLAGKPAELNLDLHERSAQHLHLLFGDPKLSRAGDQGRYLVKLEPYGCAWLRVMSEEAETGGVG